MQEWRSLFRRNQTPQRLISESGLNPIQGITYRYPTIQVPNIHGLYIEFYTMGCVWSNESHKVLPKSNPEFDLFIQMNLEKSIREPNPSTDALYTTSFDTPNGV